MASYVVKTPGETAALGERLGKSLAGGEILAFTGGMGSGKTTFCGGLARGLGCTDPVSSPTFAIANFYRGPRPLAHFDAYRISGAEDLETAGFYDYLDEGAVVAVEWSENVSALLPAGGIALAIAVNTDGSRTITIEGAKGF